MKFNSILKVYFLLFIAAASSAIAERRRMAEEESLPYGHLLIGIPKDLTDRDLAELSITPNGKLELTYSNGVWRDVSYMKNSIEKVSVTITPIEDHEFFGIPSECKGTKDQIVCEVEKNEMHSFSLQVRRIGHRTLKVDPHYYTAERGNQRYAMAASFEVLVEGQLIYESSRNPFADQYSIFVPFGKEIEVVAKPWDLKSDHPWKWSEFVAGDLLRCAQAAWGDSCAVDFRSPCTCKLKLDEKEEVRSIGAARMEKIGQVDVRLLSVSFWDNPGKVRVEGLFVKSPEERRDPEDFFIESKKGCGDVFLKNPAKSCYWDMSGQKGSLATLTAENQKIENADGSTTGYIFQYWQGANDCLKDPYNPICKIALQEEFDRSTSIRHVFLVTPVFKTILCNEGQTLNTVEGKCESKCGENFLYEDKQCKCLPPSVLQGGQCMLTGRRAVAKQNPTSMTNFR